MQCKIRAEAEIVCTASGLPAASAGRGTSAHPRQERQRTCATCDMAACCCSVAPLISVRCPCPCHEECRGAGSIPHRLHAALRAPRGVPTTTTLALPYTPALHSCGRAAEYAAICAHQNPSGAAPPTLPAHPHTTHLTQAALQQLGRSLRTLEILGFLGPLGF